MVKRELAESYGDGLFASPGSSKVRSMNALEESFWLLDQRASEFTVLIGAVEGAASVEEWTSAVAAVFHRHRALSASIHKVKDSRAFFEASRERLNFRILNVNDDTGIERIMERELGEPFRDRSASLISFKLYHGFSRSFLVVTSRHALLDGESNTIIFREILSRLNGEAFDLDTRPFLSASELTGIPQSDHYAKSLRGNRTVAAGSELAEGSKKVHVYVVRIGSEEVGQGRSKAAGINVGLYAAVMASLVLAGREKFESWRGPIATIASVDLRPSLDIRDALGVFIGLHWFVVDGTKSTWKQLAKLFEADLKKVCADRKAEAKKVFARLDELLSEQREGTNLYALGDIHSSAVQLMVRNYERHNTRDRFGKLTLSALASGSSAGDSLLQGISIFPHGGELTLTLVSRTPLPGLLDCTRAIFSANEPAQ
jgi:hypothetical protein